MLIKNEEKNDNKKLQNNVKKDGLMIILILPADRAPPCSVNTLIGALPHLPPTKDKYKNFGNTNVLEKTKFLGIQKFWKIRNTNIDTRWI